MAEVSNLKVRKTLDQSKGTPMAGAATVEIGYADGNTINITGTTTITSFGAAKQDGVVRVVIFDGILTLTHGTSLKLPGERDIITAAGDIAFFIAESATVWKCAGYTRAGVAPESPILLSSAPVNGVKSTVTIDMTAPTSDMTYTAVAYGADGNDITVTHTDPSGNDEDLTVTVSGTDIDISLATDGSGTITSTAALVKAAVNDHAEASLLVLAEDEDAGTGLVNAEAETSLTGGVDVTAGGLLSYHINSAGDTVYVKTSTEVWKQFLLYAPTLSTDAPVSGVKATVTIDMTAPTSDMTYTAVAYGTAGNSITVTHTDPSAIDQALAVTVDSNDIDISLATDGSGTITTIASEVKAAVNVHAEASLLVLAEDEGAGTGLVNADTETSLTGGVDVTAGGILGLHVKSDGTLGYMKVSEQVWKQFTLDALA